MQQTTERADFVRFRETGDAEAMARVFDAVAPRLLLVAAHLCRDAGEAEDLVQATMVQVIEQAQRFDARRPLLPWMLGILAHRSLDAARRRRVRAADPLGEPVDALDPADLVQNAELREEIARAVDGLEEPYRGVVLLRLLHGLQPTEIAHAQGRPPGTVRVQLQRGLERLRRSLPRGLALPAFLFEGDRNWEVLRAEVLRHAGRHVVTASASTVGTKLVGLACVVVGLPLIAWLASRSSSQEARSEDLPTVHLEARFEPNELPVVTARVEAAAVREPAVADEGASTLTVTVLRADGTHAEDVGVHLRPAKRPSLGNEARTDAEGSAEFAALTPGDYVLEVDRWVREPLPVAIVGNERLELRLPEGVAFQGIAVERGSGSFDPFAPPVGGAEIFFLHPLHPDRLMRVAVADDQGKFSIEDAGPGELIARAAGYQPSSSVSIRPLASRLSFHYPLALTPTRSRLRGSVTDALGHPVPFASIQVLVDEDARKGGRSEPTRGIVDTDSIFLRADAAGVFDSSEVPPGPLGLIARPLDTVERVDGRIAVHSGTLLPGDVLEVQLVLGSGAEVFGRVLDANGEPAPDLLVEAEWRGVEDLGSPDDEMGELLARAFTRTTADGSYSLTGLAPGQARIEVRPTREARSLAMEAFELAGSESVRWDATVTLPSELAVRLLGPAEKPLEGWLVELDGEAVWTDEEGRCRLTDLRQEPGGLEIHAPVESTERSGGASAFLRFDRGETRLIRRVHDIVPRTEELVLRIAHEELPSASIAGRVLFDGPPSRGASVRLDRMGKHAEFVSADIHDYLSPDGSFALPELVPGTYRVRLRSEEYASQRFGPFTVAADERVETGTLVAISPARAEVRVTVSDGLPVDDCRVYLRPLEASVSDAGDVRSRWHQHELRQEKVRDRSILDRFLPRPRRSEEDRPYESRPLVPGDYTLVIQGRDLAPHTERVTLVSGITHEFAPVCPRGGSQTFRVVLEEDAELRGRSREEARLHLIVEDEEGRCIIDRRDEYAFTDPARLEVDCSVALRPGRYHARIEDHRRGSWSGAYAEVDFEIRDDGERTPMRVEIPLP